MHIKILVSLLLILGSTPTTEEVALEEPPINLLINEEEIEEEIELVYGLRFDPTEYEKEEPVTQQVSITSFYDNSFGSGAKLSNFTTNKYGMTIDQQGYLVVATATNECLRSNDSGCARYNSVPTGYSVWSYGDTFDIYFHTLDITIPAKVYDSCGACFWNETYQRVDIHTNGTPLGKIRGEIIYP